MCTCKGTRTEEKKESLDKGEKETDPSIALSRQVSRQEGRETDR